MSESMHAWSTRDVGFCIHCGWDHSNLGNCWRKVLPEAFIALARDDLDPTIRAELKQTVDAFVRGHQEDIAFFADLARVRSIAAVPTEPTGETK